MVDYMRGIKAGLPASIIHAIILNVIILYFIGPSIIGITPAELAQLGAGYWVNAIIGGIIEGIIIGVIFSALYDRLPGKTSIIKGIIMGLIFWVIFGLLLGVVLYGFFAPLYGLEFVTEVFFFGILLGVFWDMFGGMKKT